MARDTAAIGEDVVIGDSTPDVETTVEALIRAYNRLPLDTNLTTGDRMEWDGTAWVPVGKDTSLPAFDLNGSLYYPPHIPGAEVTTRTASSGVLFAVPLLVAKAETLIRVSIEVTTAGAASSLLRLGVYEDSDGKPGTLLLEAGAVAADSTGGKEITISQAVTAEWYWLAAMAEGGSPTIRALSGISDRVATSAVASGTQANSWFASGVSTGALPDPFPASNIAADAPLIRWRVS